MFMALFPTVQSGCFVGQNGPHSGMPYGFDTLEQAKFAAESFLKAQSNNAFIQAAPILILDLETLEIVSSVRSKPISLPWQDRSRGFSDE
jgi:hypothetical protein